MNSSTLIWLTLFLLAPVMAHAQDTLAPADNEELNVIEVELDKGKTAPPSAKATVTNVNGTTTAAPTTSQPDNLENKKMDYSGLGKLAPFSEISVIQKKYLPKTGRFQVFGGLSMITNNPWYNSYGAVLKGSYFFTESLGVEFNYFTMQTSSAKSTQELNSIDNVATNSLITTQAFKGIDAMFVPIYGKMTFFNKRIIPFDLYFSTGYGMTTVANNDGSKDEGTLHLGTGQIFAVSKGQAFRWDFSWNFFNAVGVDGKSGAYNNLFLTLGWSWFFPEATYR